MNKILLAYDDLIGDVPPYEGQMVTGTETAETSQAQPAGNSNGESEGIFGSFGNAQFLITMLLVFAVMYFITIRPQKKREAQLREIQSTIKTGDWVVTFSGMYGKVVDVGDEVVMVEFGQNKSVLIPVRKKELTKAEEPVLTITKDENKE